MVVHIVDDEKYIREWIHSLCRNILSEEDGKKLQVSVNGEMALKKNATEPADVFLVDIQMPIIDGLELTRQIRQSGQKAYIAILTSFDSFDYARKAINLDVNEYVLKTEINEQYLTDILDRAEKWLKKSSDEQVKEISSINEFCQDAEKYFKEGSAEKLEEKYEIKLPETSYFMMAYISENEDILIQTIESREIIQKFFIKCKNTVYFCFEVMGFASRLYQYEKIFSYIKKMGQINSEAFICYSDIAENPKDIAQRLLDVERGLNERYYSKGNVFNVMTKRNREDEFRTETELSGHYLEILNSIYYEKFNELKNKLTTMFDYIDRKHPMNVEYILLMCKEICEANYYKLYSGQHELFEKKKQEMETHINNVAKISDLRAFLLEETEAAASGMISIETQSPPVREALMYIVQNYRTIENISEIADYVCLNTKYFSRLFKNETGKNFSDYLNDYRLERSVDMLLNSTKKVYEIAEEVGFASLSYYSKKFKEKYGISPQNFKAPGAI